MSSFSWGEFLTFAQELWRASVAMGGKPAMARTEALRRAVISRAYYAAYHPAHTFVSKKYPRSGAKGGEHEYTWTTLAASSDRDEMLHGQKGATLKLLRVRADYNTAAVSDLHVDQALGLAQTVRAAVAKFNP